MAVNFLKVSIEVGDIGRIHSDLEFEGLDFREESCQVSVMLSAAVDRVDIVRVVLVIVRLALHLWAVGPIIRRSWVAMGLRLGWI